MQPRHRFSVFAGLQWTWTFVEKVLQSAEFARTFKSDPHPPHTHLLPLEDWMEHKRSWRKWMIAMKKTTLKLPFEESVLPDSVLQAFAELLVCLHLCGLMSCWVPWVCFCPHGMPRSVSRNASWGFDMWCHWSEAWKQFHRRVQQPNWNWIFSVLSG